MTREPSSQHINLQRQRIIRAQELPAELISILQERMRSAAIIAITWLGVCCTLLLLLLKY